MLHTASQSTLHSALSGIACTADLMGFCLQLEGILFPIMQRMISQDGQDVFEEVRLPVTIFLGLFGVSYLTPSTLLHCKPLPPVLCARLVLLMVT